MIFVYGFIGLCVFYFVVRLSYILYSVYKYVADSDDDRYGGYWNDIDSK